MASVVAGREGQATWIVRKRDAPKHWLIEGRTSRGGGGTVAYTLTPRDGGTFFEREFVYEIHGIKWVLLDRFVVRPRIQAESNEAVRRLKQVLEST
jgi:hypothetical protein